MKKALFLLSFMALFSIGTRAQLLYKVWGNGLASPSYIVGTYHLANTAFIDKIAGAKDAIMKTSQIVGELKLEDMMNPDSLEWMKQAATMAADSTIKDVLTPAEYAKLNTTLKAALGADLTNPMVMQQMGHLNPLSLTIALEMTLFMQRHMGEFDPTNPMDAYFQKQAQANNEPTAGLETVAAQTRLLVSSMPMKQQVQLLMCFLDNQEQWLMQMENMRTAYYDQDLDKLKTILDDQQSVACANSPEMDEKLITKRNSRWLTLMPAIMSTRPTLFVVGAGHLPGEKGVLQGLRNLGYTVEGVK